MKSSEQNFPIHRHITTPFKDGKASVGIRTSAWPNLKQTTRRLEISNFPFRGPGDRGFSIFNVYFTFWPSFAIVYAVLFPRRHRSRRESSFLRLISK